MTAGWISAVVKVLAAAMCAKRTSACISASCRGWSSLRPGMRFPVDVTVGSASFRNWPRSTKVFQNVPLNVEVIIVDRRERVLEDRQIFDGLVDAVVVDVVARGLSPQDEVIANVLLDETVAIVTANYRVWQAHVLDLGLQLASTLLGDLATEDHGDLVRLPDCPIGIEQALAKIIQCRTAMKDEVVAIFDLREEQPMLAARMLALPCSEEGREVCQPLLATAHQIARGERVGEFLQAIGNCAFQEGIGGLLESDAFLAHPVGQPMVLVEADTGGGWQVGADAHEGRRSRHDGPSVLRQSGCCAFRPAPSPSAEIGRRCRAGCTASPGIAGGRCCKSRRPAP